MEVGLASSAGEHLHLEEAPQEEVHTELAVDDKKKVVHVTACPKRLVLVLVLVQRSSTVSREAGEEQERM